MPLLLDELLKLTTRALRPELRVKGRSALSAGAAVVQAFDLGEECLPVGVDELLGAWRLEQWPALASSVLPTQDGGARQPATAQPAGREPSPPANGFKLMEEGADHAVFFYGQPGCAGP